MRALAAAYAIASPVLLKRMKKTFGERMTVDESLAVTSSSCQFILVAASSDPRPFLEKICE